MVISTNQEALRLVIKRESLTEKEASQIISNLDKKKFLEELLDRLKYRHLMSEGEIKALFKQRSSASSALALPVSIFKDSKLSALESICRYLKDEKGLRYSEIGLLMNRDQRTIWVTYTNSKKKKEGKLDSSASKYSIPLSVFQDRRLSVLESIAHHLKSKYSLRYSEIARLLGRDERNIWNICDKAGRKLHAK